MGITYTETFTIQALLQTLQSSTNQFDVLMFDGNLIGNDGLTNHVRTINSTIPMICLTDDSISPQGEYSHMYGNNEVILNPPTSIYFSNISSITYCRFEKVPVCILTNIYISNNDGLAPIALFPKCFLSKLPKA